MQVLAKRARHLPSLLVALSSSHGELLSVSISLFLLLYVTMSSSTAEILLVFIKRMSIDLCMSQCLVCQCSLSVYMCLYARIYVSASLCLPVCPFSCVPASLCARMSQAVYAAPSGLLLSQHKRQNDCPSQPGSVLLAIGH